MRRSSPWFALALAAAGCAHRFPLPLDGGREAIAGVSTAFGAPGEPVPEGTRIQWDFGDGSPAVSGAAVEHAFARAGEYQVGMRVQDARGVREARVRVRVRRRSPAAALPPGARWAVVLDGAFARAARFAALSERLAGSDRTAAALRGLERALGFDLLRPDSVLAAGLDPEVGLAAGALPGDPGTWLAIGVADGAAALERLERTIVLRGGIAALQPDGSLLAALQDEETVAFVRRGFLYVHFGRPEGPVARAAIEEAPLEGLFADAAFASARAQVEGGDAFAFVRVDAFPLELQAKIPDALEPVLSGATALALGLTLREGEADAAALLALDAGSLAEMRRLAAAPRRPGPLASIAPPGAVAFASLPMEPALARRLFATHARDLLRQALLPSEILSLSALLSGELGLAVYLDVPGLYRDLAAGASPSPRLHPLVALGLTDRAAAAALLRGAKGLPSPLEGRPDAWATTIEASPGGVALAGEVLEIGAGEPFLQSLRDDPARPRLAEALRGALPPAALEPGHLVVFVDVGQAFDSLRDPPPISGMAEARRRLLGAMAAAFLDQAPQLRPALQLRDLLLDAWPAEAGLRARLRVRFR